MRSAGWIAVLWMALAVTAAAENPLRIMVDGDADGVSDDVDVCLYSPAGVPVDDLGCAADEDSDGDGIPNQHDFCPNSSLPVDAFGCSVSSPKQNRVSDLDADGVADVDDQCPYSAPGSIVDANGCALDSDLDGVPDGVDRCPKSAYAQSVNAQGCTGVRNPGDVAQIPLPGVPTGPLDLPAKPEPVAALLPGPTVDQLESWWAHFDPMSLPSSVPYSDAELQLPVSALRPAFSLAAFKRGWTLLDGVAQADEAVVTRMMREVPDPPTGSIASFQNQQRPAGARQQVAEPSNDIGPLAENPVPLQEATGGPMESAPPASIAEPTAALQRQTLTDPAVEQNIPMRTNGVAEPELTAGAFVSKSPSEGELASASTAVSIPTISIPAPPTPEDAVATSDEKEGVVPVIQAPQIFSQVGPSGPETKQRTDPGGNLADIPERPLAVVAPREEASSAQSPSTKIQFVRGSSELDGAIMSSLKQAAPEWRSALISDSRLQLRVTQNERDPANLAQNRAKIVRAYLMSVGISPRRMQISRGFVGDASVGVELVPTLE